MRKQQRIRRCNFDKGLYIMNKRDKIFNFQFTLNDLLLSFKKVIYLTKSTTMEFFFIESKLIHAFFAFEREISNVNNKLKYNYIGDNKWFIWSENENFWGSFWKIPQQKLFAWEVLYNFDFDHVLKEEASYIWRHFSTIRIISTYDFEKSLKKFS